MKDMLGLQIIIVGLIIVLIGIVIKLGLPLGRLPGDIRVKGDNFSLYLPLTTSILISIVLSLILRFFK